jgi:hypothetical protein
MVTGMGEAGTCRLGPIALDSVQVRLVPLQPGTVVSWPGCHAVVQRIPSDAARRPIDAPLGRSLRAHGEGAKDRWRHDDRRDMLPYRPYRLTVRSRKGSPHQARRWDAFGIADSYGRASYHG